MAEFINTIDVLGDDAVIDSIIDRTITEFKDDQITKVGDYAFNSCTALTEVDLPNATNIGNDSFQNCSSIQGIALPNVTYLGNNAFKNAAPCVIRLPKWTSNGIFPFIQTKAIGIVAPILTTLGDSMFRFAYSLQYAEFGSLTAIAGNHHFANAPLTVLVIRTNKMCTLASTSSFSDSAIAKGTGHVYVPRALVDTYKAATNWSTYAAQFRALEDYTVDGTITGELDESKI